MKKSGYITKKEKQNEILAQLIYEYNESYNAILVCRRMIMYINILNQASYSEIIFVD